MISVTDTFVITDENKELIIFLKWKKNLPVSINEVKIFIQSKITKMKIINK